jgi:hypothetical protein
MKKIWLGILFLIILTSIILFKQQIYENLTTSTYWELSNEEVTKLTEQRKRAYDYAVSCSGIKNPKLRFDEITWVLLPGSVIKIKTDKGTVTFKGIFEANSNIIYMPFTERNTFWIMAHESMHAIGYIGHPYHPFKTCWLMAEQQ